MNNGTSWIVQGDRRARRIAETCELVIQVMNLRPPQAEALRNVAGALQRLPRPLSECSREERRSFLTDGTQWQHAAHPTFTLALATGVGKTRLAGGIMALLYLCKEARTFLILAPRRAVLRRFSDALDPQFREYIFVEQSLVPEPYVVTGDLIADPAGVEAMFDMFRTGPSVYLLSPQLITTSERFRGQQTFTGKSPLDHLKSKDDLVVLVDEAHHVGGLGQAEAAKWTEAIRELEPALQFGLTATPRGEDGENILYEYPLSRALIEQLYVKDVHLLVRNFERSSLSDEDVDKATISYALGRLHAKENSVGEIDRPPFPNVKPVCLFFARDIAHAEWVMSHLKSSHSLSDEEILITHSRSSKKEEEIERLLSIEKIDNPVRVVVNVQELTEGWDVTNVYVIAPLRSMATFQGALQSMGRGLRLPAGQRVGEPEVDTLDVVCFGKQSLQLIVEEATTWLGRNKDDGTAGIIIDDHTSSNLITQTLNINRQRDIPKIELCELENVHEEVSLSVDPAAISGSAQMAVEELSLVKLKAQFAKQKVIKISREAFKQAATARVLQVASNYLSDDVHFDRIGEVISAWLEATGISDEEVDFDPSEIGEELGRIIVDGARKRALAYQETGRSEVIDFADFQISVPISCPDSEAPPPLNIKDLEIVSKGSFTPGMIVAGADGHRWSTSLHAAYTFDSWPEVRVGWLLDHDAEVDWWVRNQPRRLRIQTPAGRFSPDFVVRMNNGDYLILEVKGSIYWEPPESEPRIKARSAEKWCEMQSLLSGQNLSFGLVLDSDVEAASSFAILKDRIKSSQKDS